MAKPSDLWNGSLLDWVEKHGKLREKALRPADDPLAAAEKLAARPHPKWMRTKRPDRLLRVQAWQAIAHLVKLPPGMRNYWSDSRWEESKKLAAKLKIRWSEQQQNYVAE